MTAVNAGIGEMRRSITIAGNERHAHRHHENAGRDINAGELERREEHNQRAQIERQPAQLLGCWRALMLPPSALWRKLRASKGCRSSPPSPTPMKWTGSPNFVGQRHQDAALGRAVELGHHQAGQRHRRLERLDL